MAEDDEPLMCELTRELKDPSEVLRAGGLGLRSGLRLQSGLQRRLLLLLLLLLLRCNTVRGEAGSRLGLGLRLGLALKSG